MKVTAIILALVAGVVAMPTGGGEGGGPGGGAGGIVAPGGGTGGGGGAAYDACSGLYDSAQCCATDVLGVADLNCGTPSAVPTSPAQFSATCAAIGQRARCCVLPILAQGVLCQTPIGVTD